MFFNIFLLVSLLLLELKNVVNEVLGFELIFIGEIWFCDNKFNVWIVFLVCVFNDFNLGL